MLCFQKHDVASQAPRILLQRCRGGYNSPSRRATFTQTPPPQKSAGTVAAVRPGSLTTTAPKRSVGELS